MTDNQVNTKNEVSVYWKTLIILLLLTIINVALHQSKLILIFATIIAAGAALIFMHLKSERQSIYVVLIFAVIFLIGMFSLTIGASYSVPEGTEMLNRHYRNIFPMHHGGGAEEEHSQPQSEQKAEHGT